MGQDSYHNEAGGDSSPKREQAPSPLAQQSEQGAPEHSATQTSSQPSRESIYQASLENAGGGAAEGETTTLHESTIPTYSSPQLAGMEARRINITAQLGQGVGSVTNMRYEVGGMTLTGPVTFNQFNGQEYLVDPNSGKYRILPGDEKNPQGYLQPAGKGDTQPIPISTARPVGGETGFNQIGWNKPPDFNQMAQQARQTDSAQPSTTDRTGSPSAPSDGTAAAGPQKSPPLALPGGYMAKSDGSIVGPDGNAVNPRDPQQAAGLQQLMQTMKGQIDQQLQQIAASRPDAGSFKGISPDQLLAQLQQSNDPRLQALANAMQQALVMASDTRSGAQPAAAASDGHAHQGADKADAQLVAQLANPDSRRLLVDFLSLLQNGRLPFDMSSKEGQAWQDVARSLGPGGLQSLRGVLADGDANSMARLGSLLDPRGQERLRDFLELLLNRREAQANLAPSSPFDRLLDTLRNGDRLAVGKLPDADGMRLMLGELSRSLRDFSRALGLEPGQGALTLQDMIGRSFDPQGNPWERLQLTMRLNTGDEAVLRALLDRLQGRQAEQRRGDFTTKSEGLTGRWEANGQNMRVDDALRNVIRRELGTRDDADARAAANLEPPKPELKLQPKPEDRDPDKLDDADVRRTRKNDNKAETSDVESEAALIGLAKKPKPETPEKEDEEEASADKNKKDPDKRQRYVVKEGDTLESIAQKQLRDKRLSGLIYEINKQAIPLQEINGKSVPQLRPRLIIWLPTAAESAQYRGKLAAAGADSAATQRAHFASAEDELSARFGAGWPGDAASDSGEAPSGQPSESLEDMLESAVSHYSERRRRIEETLGPLGKQEEDAHLKHVVRLGDSLKTIAMNHPALKDIRLWKLLAHVNNLPESSDEKGTPLAKLKRGQVLRLPSDEQIAAYRAQQAKGGAESPLGMFTVSCPACGRETFLSASICPRCGANLPRSASVEAEQIEQPQPRMRGASTTRPLQDAPGMTPSGAVPDPKPFDPTRITPADPTLAARGAEQSGQQSSKSGYTVERMLSEKARVARSGSPADLQAGFRVCLEILRDSAWLPAIVYEIKANGSQRHEYRPDGSRKTLQVDLPIAAVIELAYNDINSTWQKYE